MHLGSQMTSKNLCQNSSLHRNFLKNLLLTTLNTFRNEAKLDGNPCKSLRKCWKIRKTTAWKASIIIMLIANKLQSVFISSYLFFDISKGKQKATYQIESHNSISIRPRQCNKMSHRVHNASSFAKCYFLKRRYGMWNVKGKMWVVWQQETNMLQPK